MECFSNKDESHGQLETVVTTKEERFVMKRTMLSCNQYYFKRREICYEKNTVNLTCNRLQVNTVLFITNPTLHITNPTLDTCHGPLIILYFLYIKLAVT